MDPTTTNAKEKDHGQLLHTLCQQIRRPVVLITTPGTGTGTVYIHDQAPAPIEMDLEQGRPAAGGAPLPLRPIIIVPAKGGGYDWWQYRRQAEPTSREMLRVARRGGVKRSTIDCHPEGVATLRAYLRRVLRTCVILMEGRSQRNQTLDLDTVVQALRHNDTPIYT